MKYSAKWFEHDCGSRRNKEEFFFGPYTCQDKELWIKSNKLRKARVERDLRMRHKHNQDSMHKLNMKIFKRGKMSKNFQDKNEYENFITNLVDEPKKSKPEDFYMMFNSKDD